MSLFSKRVTLGVCGSIAAYRAADVARALVHEGALVQAVLTRNATRFIPPETLRALTKNPVLTDVFDEPFPDKIAHIEVAQSTDLLLIAPATANTLAKMAQGIADDLLTTIYLATTAPVMVAPAMNAQMLAHPATQANLRTLQTRGVQVVAPAYGILACETEGWGKLAPVDEIVEAVKAHFTKPQPLLGKHVLVTAGPTREPLDPVRYLTNRSSGKMGVALAEAAREAGATVTLVHGPLEVPLPAGVTALAVQTTAEMLDACRAPFTACDLFIAAAAPADFTPESVAEQKIKKGSGQMLTLVPTPDILATLASEKRPGQFIVGFAAETNDVLGYAAEKLTRKKLDLMVANDVTAPGAGFGVDTNIVTLLFPDGRQVPLPQLPKRAVAARILEEFCLAAATQA